METNGNNTTIRSLLSSFDRLGTHEQAAFLTLPLLLLYVDDHWYVKVPVVTLALAGLIFGDLRSNPYFWFSLVCFMAAGIYFNWQTADNHKYLITYWCLALFFTCFFSAGEDALRTSARYLIGFAFSLALIWKLITPDFMNGDFFEYSFLFDDRFSHKLKVFGVLHAEAIDFNRLAEDALTAYDSSLLDVDVLTSYTLKQWANGLVWWTVVLEGLIAVCFLAARKYKLALPGDILLIAFLLSTYLIAPVIGFGWVIGAMGFIQCDPSHRKIRLAYLITILVLQAYRMPWSAIANSAFQAN